MRMRMQAGYRNWALTAAGLLGVTYGVGRLLRGKRDARSIGAAAVAVPLSIGGLMGWTRSLARSAHR